MPEMCSGNRFPLSGYTGLQADINRMILPKLMVDRLRPKTSIAGG